MQIKVRCECGDDECPEWAIVELQGVVEPQAPISGTDLRGLEIGRLCCVSEGKYTLTVGYHELVGSKVTLKKPLVVLRKKKIEEGKASGSVELEVIGIIRQKILFNSRPRALITSSSAASSAAAASRNVGVKVKATPVPPVAATATGDES